MSGKNVRLSQRDAGAACRRCRGKTLLAVAAKDVVALIPGERQREILIVGIRSEK